MLTGWGDAVGVWCVDAHMVGTCFEMLYNHLDEFVGRSAPIVVESDIDVDVTLPCIDRNDGARMRYVEYDMIESHCSS